MNEVFLIQSCGALHPSKTRVVKIFVPWSLGIIQQALKNNGFATKMIDLEAKLNYYERQISDKEMEEWIYNDKKGEKIKIYLDKCMSYIPVTNKTKLIGFSITYSFKYYYTLALAKMIKISYPEIKVCLGGAHLTRHSVQNPIPDFIDYVIKGDGSSPMVHLCKHIYHKTDIDHVGLWHRDTDVLVDKGIYNDEPAEEEAPPDYTGLDINDYVIERPSVRTIKIDFEKYVVFPYRTHKGCTNACSFCTDRSHYKPTTKSAEKVFREIQNFTKLYPDIYIVFSDLAINNFPDSLNNILDLIIENNLVINFQTYAKMNNMSIELIEKLQKAGCRDIIWGIEHFSPKMIRYYNKKFNAEEAELILKRCAELNILSQIGLVVNYPGETEKDFQFIKKKIYKLLKYRLVGFSIRSLHLWPGSLMYRNPEKYGMKKVEISESNPDFLNKIKWIPIDMPLEQFQKVWLKREAQRQKLQAILNRTSKLYMKKIYLPIQVIIILVTIKRMMKNIKNRIFSVLF